MIRRGMQDVARLRLHHDRAQVLDAEICERRPRRQPMERHQAGVAVQRQVQRRDVRESHEHFRVRAHQVVIDRLQQGVAARAAASGPDALHLGVAEHRVQVGEPLRHRARVAPVGGEQVATQPHAQAQRLEVLHPPLDPAGSTPRRANEPITSPASVRRLPSGLLAARFTRARKSARPRPRARPGACLARSRRVELVRRVRRRSGLSIPDARIQPRGDEVRRCAVKRLRVDSFLMPPRRSGPVPV